MESLSGADSCLNDSVLRAVQHFMPSATVLSVEAISGSNVNSLNYRLRGDWAGRAFDVLLRRCRFLSTRPQVQATLELLQHLERCNVPVSRVIPAQTGELFAESDGAFWILFEYINGHHFIPSREAFVELARAVAKMHRAFVALPADLMARLCEASQQNSSAYYNRVPDLEDRRFAEILERAAAQDLAIKDLVLGELPKVRAMQNGGPGSVRAARSARTEPGPPMSLIHSDLHPLNALFSGDQLLALLDFDAVRRSERARDIAFAIYRFGILLVRQVPEAERHALGQQLVKAFLREYESINPLEHQEREQLGRLFQHEYTTKLLFVLSRVYLDGNREWIGDTEKFFSALKEGEYFWGTAMNDKLKYLQEAYQYIPAASQTLSKNPRQYVVGVTPVAVERAEGAYFWDHQGNRYLDLVMGLGPFVFGYSNRRINEAVKREVDRGTVFSLPATLELELAKLLREVVPCAEMSRFLSNGNDATSGAIRLARHITGREQVAKCGYHGCQDWSIANTPGRNTGVPDSVKALTHEFKYNDLASLQMVLEVNPGKVAAVIMEACSNEPPKPGFLAAARDLAHKHGALFIFDEMVTGFRWALGGAQQYFGVTPDIGCFGKAVASGFPLAIICGKAEYMRRMDEIFVSMTFGGFTPSLRAAIETITMMREQDPFTHMHCVGERLIAGGNAIAQKFSLPIKFCGFGPHPFVVVSGEDRLARIIKSYIYQEMNKAGILFSTSIMMSAAHSEADIDWVLREFERICRDMSKYADLSKLESLLEGEIIAPRTVRVVQ